MSNKKFDEHTDLARWSKQNINPDFHLVGQIELKFSKREVLVGLCQIHVSKRFSCTVIFTSKNEIKSLWICRKID